LSQPRLVYLRTIGLGNFIAAIILQSALGIFLAHGYDFRVNYVAGRNIASGLSPYIGGGLTGDLAAGYGPLVQGMGETPLWALYMGLAYILSDGQVYLFNIISKIPIILANIALSYIAVRRGCDGMFFLLNPFTLLVTASWGKPDNMATLLGILSLLCRWGPLRSSLTISTSLLVKPIGLSLAASYIGYFRRQSKMSVLVFVTASTTLSMILFLMPFKILSWPLQTVVEGLPNWFKPAGGISPLNIVEALAGKQELPDSLLVLGYLAPMSIPILMVISYLHPPSRPEKAISLALLGSLLFFSLRPWVSEQNLFIILTLIILVNRRLPTKLLWIVPLLFSLANLSLPQNLYLVRPSIIGELQLIDGMPRLLIRMALSLIWLALVWKTVLKAGMLRWRD
jgi:hypothetical protein